MFMQLLKHGKSASRNTAARLALHTKMEQQPLPVSPFFLCAGSSLRFADCPLTVNFVRPERGSTSGEQCTATAPRCKPWLRLHPFR